MRRLVLPVTLIALFAGAGLLGWRGLAIAGEADLSFHGWLALGIALLFTLVLGAGLMALVFFSARRGHDARAAAPLHDERGGGEES